MRFWLSVVSIVISPFIAGAHDTWIETNTGLVRQGDVVHIDLKLGNHGNNHRDFKLASKIGLATIQMSVVDPKGVTVDLKPRLIDMGLSAKDGYWTTRYVASEPGMYVVSQTAESMRGKTRSMKSGKAYFLASKKLDEVPSAKSGFDKPVGHAWEIVPLSHPITDVGPGQPIRVRVLLQSQPLKGARVSFVPRGVPLDEGFDKEHERETDADGVATYTPKEGNVILIVVHHSAVDQKGDGFDGTTYSSTLTIAVPQVGSQHTKAVTSR